MKKVFERRNQRLSDNLMKKWGYVNETEDDWAHIDDLAHDAHVDRKEREELEEGIGTMTGPREQEFVDIWNQKKHLHGSGLQPLHGRARYADIDEMHQAAFEATIKEMGISPDSQEAADARELVGLKGETPRSVDLEEEKKSNIIQQMIGEIEKSQGHKLNEGQRRAIEASVRKKLKESYFDRMMAKGKKKWAGVKRVGGMAKKIGAAARGEEYGEEAKDFSSIEFCSMVEKKAKKLQSFFDAMQTDWEEMDFDLRNPKDKKSPAHALRKVQIAAQGLQDFVNLCKAGKIEGLKTGDEVDNECLFQIEQWIQSHPKQDMGTPRSQKLLTIAMEKKGCKVPDDYFEKEGAGGSEGGEGGADPENP